MNQSISLGQRAIAILGFGILAAAAFACENNPTGPTEPGTGPPGTPAEQTWRGISVAPEQRCSPYDSDDYRYPPSIETQIVERLGGVYSPYTCEIFGSTRETDIEHVLARSEAHDSGLCSADQATRDRFATDLDNLTLAAPRLNRHEKSGNDAAEWMPEENRCWFAQTIVDVRRKYNLSIDQAEADALERVLAGCAGTTLACRGF